MNWERVRSVYERYRWRDWVTWVLHGFGGIGIAAAVYVLPPFWAAVLLSVCYFGIWEYNNYFVGNEDRSRKKQIDGIADFVTAQIGVLLFALVWWWLW